MGSIPWSSLLSELESGFTSETAMGGLEGFGLGAAGELLTHPGAALSAGKRLLGFGGGRKHRRMNPLNGRAARRAIRRIAGAMHMLRSIEHALPRHRTPKYHFPRHPRFPRSRRRR